MKKAIYIISALFILHSYSCSTYQLTGIKGKSATYVVKVGKHEMEGGRLMLLKDSDYSFSITTDSSWVWDIPEENGFSKVTGIGWFVGEEKNSARLVYINKANNVHEFWSYFYVKGISPQQDTTLRKKLIDVEIGKKYNGSVGYDNGWYTVMVGNEHHSVKADIHITPYLMNPYIGGTYTIDHDWIVRIKYY